MKQIFIELIWQFYQIRLINSKVKLMLHNNHIDIENLTTFNSSDGFILYEKISNKSIYFLMCYKYKLLR